MMITRFVLIFIVSSLFTSLCFTQSEPVHYVNGRIEYFSKFLSSFPPQVKDSIEAKVLEHELLAFIDTLRNMRQDNALQDDELYYLWMARLYHFGYNLNIPGAWDESTTFYTLALKVNPKSTEGKMGLSAHYANNWNPGDTTTYQNLYNGFDLLRNVYREGKNAHNPALYHNMILFGLSLHSKAVCYDAMFKFMKYFPNDTNLSAYKGMAASIKEECTSWERKKNKIMYENKCAKFSVRYPDEFLLFREDPNQDKKGIGVLMIETPLTLSVYDDSIRNSFSIMATPDSISDASNLTATFMTNGRMIKDSVRMLSGDTESFYFTSRYGRLERYKGIYSIIRKGGYSYQVIYVATESTFSRNLKYFLEFEKSITIK
jgi:hypothetical protein